MVNTIKFRILIVLKEGRFPDRHKTETMSHEKIFTNVTKAIERGKVTIEDAIKNIDNDIATYTKLRNDLKIKGDDLSISEDVRIEAYERVVEFGNIIIENIELKRRLNESRK